jgi:hypothetical protein
MKRRLRIAVSVFFALVALALCVLWVRSYFGEDRVSGHASDSFGLRLYSSRGWIVCAKSTSLGTKKNYPFDVALGSEHWLAPNDSRLRFTSPRDFFSGANYASVSLPHWILMLASGVAATAVALHWRFRFSIGTLLIATTLIAAVLAVWAVR